MMINKAFIAMGANLKSDLNLTLKENLEIALNMFPDYDLNILKVSNWYKTQPIPISDQPWFINSVIKISTSKSPKELLKSLQIIEKLFGRKRNILNGPRTLDLDIIDYNGLIENNDPILPHPRMHIRKFVLTPLQDIEPNWVHPIMRKKIEFLIKKQKDDQKIIKI